MVEEKKVKPQGEIPHEGGKEIKPEEPKEEEPVTLSADEAGAETAEKLAKLAEEKKPEEKAKPEEAKTPEAPPKEKRKKIRNMNQEEIEKKLKETEERMGGLESKYAQHLLQRKEELIRKQEGQPKEK